MIVLAFVGQTLAKQQDVDLINHCTQYNKQGMLKKKVSNSLSLVCSGSARMYRLTLFEKIHK